MQQTQTATKKTHWSRSLKKSGFSTDRSSGLVVAKPMKYVEVLKDKPY